MSAIVAAVVVPAPALAVDDAESLIRQGIELRRKGDDLRAEGYLKLAYKLAQTPRSAAQLGLVEMALGRAFEANLYLTEALDSDDAWVQKSRPVLEDSRAHARSQLGEVDLVGAPAGATLKVGSRPGVAVPNDARLWLPPGETSLTIEAGQGFSMKRSVEAKVGVVVRVVVEAAPPPAVAPSAAPAPAATQQPSPPVEIPTVSNSQPDDSRGRSLRVAGLATGAAGVAVVVAGLVFRSIATSKYNAVANATSSQRFSDGDLDYRTYDKAGVASIVVGGVALAAGATMFVVGRRERGAGSAGASAPPESALNVGVGPRSVVVSASF